MKIIQYLLGDELTARYINTKFYLKQCLFLFIKASGFFCITGIFFLLVFFIIKPGPTEKIVQPLFQVYKINEKSLITTYINSNHKKIFCHQQYGNKNENQQIQVIQQIHYPSKFYTREQFCQLQHAQLPFQITRHNQIDIFITGFTKNVYYLSGCLVKLHSSEPICQKFSYQQNLKIFNNLVFENLYAIQIELKIKQTNQDIGNIQILFKQENNYIQQIIKTNYLFVTIIASLFFSLLGAGAFAILQVTDILEKAEQKQKKSKKQ